MARTLIVLAALAFVAGCFSPGYGQNSQEPFLCGDTTNGSNDACPDGYACKSGVCQKPVSGPNPGNCLDSDLEPNDTPATATSLDGSLQSHPSGVSLYGVEICTPDDVDYYSFTLTATKNVTITVQFQLSDGDLTATLDDGDDNVKATGVSTSAGLQITGLGLAAGVYYLRVSAGPDGTTNNYDFSLNIN